MILWSNIRSLRVGLLPAAAPAPAVCILLVQACLTGWSCLPALMNPQPLIGIATNQTLNCSGKARRVDFQVLMLVSSARQLDWRIAEKEIDRKSTRLNSSHLVISYAVFCLKK